MNAKNIASFHLKHFTAKRDTNLDIHTRGTPKSIFRMSTLTGSGTWKLSWESAHQLTSNGSEVRRSYKLDGKVVCGLAEDQSSTPS